MTTHPAQARNVLGELDHRIGLYHYAEDRAAFWHELFFVQSIEEYLLFLWLEADVEELQGDAAYQERGPETQERLGDAHQEAALVHYARAAHLRGGIVSLLHLEYRPCLPAWIDGLEDGWHGPQEQQAGEAIYPDMDAQALGPFADRETIEGNIIFSQVRHPSSLSQRVQLDQALHHYKAAALARRQMIGGWLPQYAIGLPRMIVDAVDLADLARLKKQFQEIQAAIARLAPETRDQQVDEVARYFHLGMVGSGRHTRALNERKLVSMDRSIKAANKLAPFYRERTRILEQIEDVWSGRNQRRRGRKSAEEEWQRLAQLRVQSAKKGDYVYDADFGAVLVVRRNQKSLTIETKSGYREPRPFAQIIDLAPDPSSSLQTPSEARREETTHEANV